MHLKIFVTTISITAVIFQMFFGDGINKLLGTTVLMNLNLFNFLSFYKLIFIFLNGIKSKHFPKLHPLVKAPRHPATVEMWDVP